MTPGVEQVNFFFALVCCTAQSFLKEIRICRIKMVLLKLSYLKPFEKLKYFGRFYFIDSVRLYFIFSKYTTNKINTDFIYTFL